MYVNIGEIKNRTELTYRESLVSDMVDEYFVNNLWLRAIARRVSTTGTGNAATGLSPRSWPTVVNASQGLVRFRIYRDDGLN